MVLRGQIFVDPGEDAEDNSDAKVNLILNNAEIWTVWTAGRIPMREFILTEGLYLRAEICMMK